MSVLGSIKNAVHVQLARHDTDLAWGAQAGRERSAISAAPSYGRQKRFRKCIFQHKRNRGL